MLRNQGKSRSLYVVTFNQLALICITMEYLENKRQFICQTIVSFFLLGLGGSLYLLFRPKTLLMFKWVDSLGLSEYLDLLRDMVSDITLNHITLYSLPDGLWLASYIIVVNTIVSKNNKYNYITGRCKCQTSCENSSCISLASFFIFSSLTFTTFLS